MSQAQAPNRNDLDTPDEDEWDAAFDDGEELDTDDELEVEPVEITPTTTTPGVENPVYTRRLFLYNGHEIADPNPDFTVDQVRKLLVPYFEDLVNASATSEVTPDGVLRVTFAKRATTKGHLTPAHLAQLLGEVAPAPLRSAETQQVYDLLQVPVDFALLTAHATAIETFLEAQEATEANIQRVVDRCTPLLPVPLTCRVPLGF